MSLTLPPIVSRLLALGILAVLILALWVGIAQPLLARFDAYRETVAQAEDQLPKLHSMAARIPLLKAELKRLEQDPTARTRQLTGANDALAAADLQNRLGKIASDNGVVLRSTQILPPVDEEGFRRISVRVAMEGDTEALLKILYGLETAPTLMFIDNLEIRSRSGGRIALNPSRQRGAAQYLLLVRFDLAGYVGGEHP